VDLSSVAGIARQSGGHVVVESAPGAGTTFTLYIPRLDAALESTDEAEAAAHEASETILLVEDDPQVRDVGRRVLERAGYTVLAVGDAEAAIAVTDRHPGHIHLLVTDVVLPRVSGRELAARLAIHRPAIKVLYVSGTSDGDIARHQILEPGIEFLEKPFSLDRLLRKVRQILRADLSATEATPWAQRSLV
jgi:DNA-binding NtrC family response regulator